MGSYESRHLHETSRRAVTQRKYDADVTVASDRYERVRASPHADASAVAAALSELQLKQAVAANFAQETSMIMRKRLGDMRREHMREEETALRREADEMSSRGASDVQTEARLVVLRRDLNQRKEQMDAVMRELRGDASGASDASDVDVMRPGAVAASSSVVGGGSSGSGGSGGSSGGNDASGDAAAAPVPVAPIRFPSVPTHRVSLHATETGTRVQQRMQ